MNEPAARGARHGVGCVACVCQARCSRGKGRDSRMAKAVGIDFGTTNSVIAVFDGGEPCIIPNARGDRVTPSAVSFTRDGEILVGAPARNQCIINHERTSTSIKRKFGSDYLLHIDGREYTPEDIAAIIIRQLKHDAQAFLDQPVTSAVITVPAYFNDMQRKCVKAAGEAAGLEVLRIINEPTAAALAYGLPRSADGRILIFDLGGGTFDVSLLDVTGTVYEVVATRGNNRLGGDDFDARLADHIMDEFQHAHGIDLRQDRMALQKVREVAEAVKKELSAASVTNINVPFISADKDGPRHLEMDVTREQFEDLIYDFVEDIADIVRACLADASAAPEHIDAVVLVGGSTRIPLVQRTLAQIFGADKILKCVNPDESVAAGAAIQAGIMTGGAHGLVLVDVAPLSLGIETENDVFVPIIERNSCIPTRMSRIFTTVADNQSSVEVHMLQGERARASANFSLGRFQLDGIKPGPRGAPRIEVLFDIDADGIVHVSARDSDTGACREVQAACTKKMSGKAVDAMLEQAAAHRAEDELFIGRNTLLRHARRLRDRVHGAIAQGRAEHVNDPDFVELVNFIDQTLRHGDAAQIRHAIEIMNEYLGEAVGV